MPWLRDLVEASPAKIRSLGELARLSLSHPGWPAGARPQVRSLAALLSKLDRGQELEWLTERPAVQDVLADVLGSSRAKITAALGSTTRSEAERTRVRLADVPYAAPLDLVEEPLPPGIPEVLFHPERWNFTWWLAPPGSGRSLTGAFLRARGLATFVSAKTWEDASTSIPESGPVFVELWGEPAETTIAPLRRDVCVATRFHPGSPDFRLVESAEPSSYVDELVNWLARRLPRDGHFTAERGRRELERARHAGLVDSLGGALGIAGLVDQYPAKDFGDGAHTLIARSLRDRFARAGRAGTGDTTWLERNADRVVTRLMRALLTNAAPWDAPRSFDEWVAIVPEEWRDRVDVEWVTTSLAETAAPKTVREVERALKHLPPGAYRVARALEHAGILRHEGDSEFLSLAPRWLALATRERALEELLSGSSLDAGEALLSADAGFLTTHVVARVRDGDSSFVEDVLDGDEPRTPEAVAATELAVRAVGLALLAGTDVPEEMLSPLWKRQAALVVPLDDGPHPRIAFGEARAREEPLLDVGIFRLAALALGEVVTEPGGTRASHDLVPATRDEARTLLHSVWTALGRFDLRTTPWALPAFDLVERLFGAARDGERDGSGLTSLEWPPWVLARLDGASLTWSEVARARDPRALDALILLAERRRIPFERIGQAMWRAWERDPSALGDGPLAPDSAHSITLFASAPPRALARAVAGGFLEARTIPFAALDAAQFRALLAVARDAVSTERAALLHIPLAVAREALSSGALDARAGRTLHLRDPSIVLDALMDALGAANETRAAALLACVPDDGTAAVVRRLADYRTLAGDATPIAAIRAFLHDRVKRRTAAYREAHGLLAALDDPP